MVQADRCDVSVPRTSRCSGDMDAAFPQILSAYPIFCPSIDSSAASLLQPSSTPLRLPISRTSGPCSSASNFPVECYACSIAFDSVSSPSYADHCIQQLQRSRRSLLMGPRWVCSCPSGTSQLRRRSDLRDESRCRRLRSAMFASRQVGSRHIRCP